MASTRDLCRVLGAALHVHDIERYAARLVRDGWLPRAGAEVDESDAATLMLAVAGAAHPSQAGEAVEAISGLPLALMSPSSMPEIETLAPASPLDAIADAIANLGRHPFTLVTVEQGAACVVVQGFVSDRPCGQFFTATYGDISTERHGLRVYVEIPPAALEAVAAALVPQEISRQGEAMPSLATH